MEKESKIVKIEFKVQGMTCESCVEEITEELSEIKGVLKINDLSWESGQGEVLALSTVDNHELRSAAEEVGYTAVVEKRQAVVSQTYPDPI